MVQLKSFEHGSVTLAYQLKGKGPLVCVLSGWGFGSYMAEAAFAPLRKEGVQLLTVDLPGTASLEERSSFVLIPRLARAVAALLRELDAAESTIIGHAFGGMVAQELALSEDDVVGKLILFSPHLGMASLAANLVSGMNMLSNLTAGDGGMIHHFFDKNSLLSVQKTLGKTFEQLNSPSKAVALSGQIWAASQWTSFGRLSKIYQPVCVVSGKRDPLSSEDQAKVMARHIPNCTLKCTDWGYLPFLENSAEALTIVTAFLAADPE
jgi:pimeloyl-ACP methyl ester carboxylesterase